MCVFQNMESLELWIALAPKQLEELNKGNEVFPDEYFGRFGLRFWHGPVKHEERDSQGRMLYRISEMAAKFIELVRVQVQKVGRPWSIRYNFYLKLQFEMQRRKKKGYLQQPVGLRCSCDGWAVCFAVVKL